MKTYYTKRPSFAVVCIEQLEERQEQALAALRRTAERIPYPCRKILVSPYWLRDPEQVKHIHQPYLGPMTTEVGFVLNRFILRDLPYLLDDADFLVLVQSDGYAVNKEAWTDEFLDYDYIGAPWTLWQTAIISPFNLSRRVGSGGFSLRSHKWYRTATTAPVFTGGCEDIFCTVKHWNHFAKAGCEIAPVSLALRWCFEHRLEDYDHSPEKSFGFHGMYRDRPSYEMSVPKQVVVMLGRWWRLYTRHFRKGKCCA